MRNNTQISETKTIGTERRKHQKQKIKNNRKTNKKTV